MSLIVSPLSIASHSDRLVPANIKQDLNTFQTNLMEILRHFWAANTVSRTHPDQSIKLTRMIRSLRLLREKLILFQKSTEQESIEIRDQLQLTLTPMFKSIQKALGEIS
jgi:hypothetical protein